MMVDRVEREPFRFWLLQLQKFSFPITVTFFWQELTQTEGYLGNFPN